MPPEGGPLHESWERVGALRGDVAQALGLSPNTLVCAGAGDNSAAAVGTQTVGDGKCNISLGTSGTIFISSTQFRVDPINDTDARGVFLGMTMDTTRADMTQAVLEGVAFAIRDSLEVARSLGLNIPRSGLCGGGSKSPLWRTILANVLGIPLDTMATEQGPGYGAAMLAMVCCGAFDSVQQAAQALVQVKDTVEPQPELVARYEAKYQKFRESYPACRGLFATLAQD